MHANSGPGSSICFDYAALSDSALKETSVKELRKRMASEHASEPTRFGIKAGEIESFLAVRGYGILRHLTADEMDAKYLAGGEEGKVPSLFWLVQARRL